MAILTALCLISPLAAGYHWIDQEDAEDWYMTPWNNSHENEVQLQDWDGEFQYFIEDIEVQDSQSWCYTYSWDGTPGNPVEIPDEGGYFVFHVKCVFQLVWTEAAPEQMTKLKIWAYLTLYRWIGNGWVSQCDDDFGIELSAEGSKADEFGLHVLEETEFDTSYDYKIHFTVIGEWWSTGPYLHYFWQYQQSDQIFYDLV